MSSKKNSLSTSGLSLSQAQSVSNMCFQEAQEIANKLNVINNSEKTVMIGVKTYVETKGNKIPANITELIYLKGKLHATQAFLMENIKAKDTMLKSIKSKVYVSELDVPVFPNMKVANTTPLVDEEWGWGQLTVEEHNEFLEAESLAAHIGQFIHKGEKLDVLRKELATIKTLEWITIDEGKKTPLNVEIHHTSEELMKIHTELAMQHRIYEARVNYFKTKVKNLVTEENARISKENSILVETVNTENAELKREYEYFAQKIYAEDQKLVQIFEENRQKAIQATSALRIKVPERFQPLIDKFLEGLEK